MFPRLSVPLFSSLLRQFSSLRIHSEEYAAKCKHLASVYSFRRATHKDLPVLMDLTRGFVQEAPLCVSLGSKMEDVSTYYEYLHSRSLGQDPSLNLALLLIHNESKKAVGFRTGNLDYRIPSRDVHYQPPTKWNKHERAIADPLALIHNLSWKLFPSEDVHFCMEMEYISPSFLVPNLALIFAEVGMDPSVMAATGARRIIAELTDRVSKTNSPMLGYEKMAEGPPFCYNDDGHFVTLSTGGIQLVSKTFSGEGSRPLLDVLPFWQSWGLSPPLH